MRASGLPKPISGEVARTRVLEQLASRFTIPVVSIVAGAGFGKSTALAQAVRANLSAPVGLDIWIGCGPGDEDADRLGRHVLAALGSANEPSAGAILGALVDASPLDVCLIIDDCHQLRHGCSGAELLADIVRHLPANAHVVLSGRSLPTLPLARLRAADNVLELGEGDLAFSATETRCAAAALERDAAVAMDVGGWPALVRLALASPAGVDRAYLIEEVLSQLSEHERDVLLSLVILGPSTSETISAVLGRPVDLASATQRFPLVSSDEFGRYTAHQLWEPAALAAAAPETLAVLQQRSFVTLLSARQFSRAGAIAVAANDLDMLDRVAADVIKTSLTSLPREAARTWLRSVPPPSWSPTLRVLDAAARLTENANDPLIAGELNEVATQARAAGNTMLESAAMAVAALAAHARADFTQLVPLAIRAAEMPDSDEHPVLLILRRTLTAVTADISGDPEGVLAAMADIPWNEMAPAGLQSAARLRLQALWMAGLGDEAVAFSERMFHRHGLGNTLAALSRWFNGDPGAPQIETGLYQLGPELNERDRFVGAVFATMALASQGRTEEMDALWADGSLAKLAFGNARDSAHLCNARAALAVVHHDDHAGALLFAEHLAQYPVTERLGERHLRRFPALGYVLNAELREFWDAAPLGPSHQMARAAGRAVLAVRSCGAITDLPPATALFTQLPLPWACELAAGLHERNDRRGVELAHTLADHIGEQVQTELRWWVAHGSEQTRRGAQGLLRALPGPPGARLHVSVLGTLQIVRNGEVVQSSELRRARVRQLLSVLVVERAVRRDRVLELLWPGLDPEAAGANLRVTLTHLRHLLEPDRSPGGAGFHLRADAQQIALHASESFTVDAWQAEALQRQLSSPMGDVATRRELFRTLVGLWRGEGFQDLEGIDGLEHVRDRFQLHHLGALLQLGELDIAAGDSAAAVECATRVLSLDEYCEQAHRLAVAGYMQLGDREGLRRCVERLLAALADLGVEPEPATAMLCRAAQRRYQPPGMPITSR